MERSKKTRVPGVILAMLASSTSLSIGVAIIPVYSTILVQCHSWSPTSVGLFNIDVILVSFLAMFHFGWFAPEVDIWLPGRDGGIYQPAHHFVHLVIPYLIGVTVVVVFGGYAPTTHIGRIRHGFS